MPSKHLQDPFHSTEEEIKTAESQAGPGFSLACFDQEFMVRPELRPVRIQLELLRPELVLRDHGIEDVMVFFGSARIPEPEVAEKNYQAAKDALETASDDPALQAQFAQAERVLHNSQYLIEAEKLAAMASADKTLDLVAVTGGGPSFMAAANKGAASVGERSIALNMILPREQDPNEYVTPELTFQFHYFAIRKMHFLMRAKALAAFPGGFGTMDELFEVLTLMQTKKIEKIPLLLFNKTFWDNTINFKGLLKEGTIRAEDLALFHFVETADEAWAHIQAFYEG